MMKQTTTAPPAGLHGAALRWATLATLMATFLGNLDASIANVALPSIAASLGTGAAGTVWVVNAYQLAFAAAVLPLSALGERIGYKRVFVAGLAIFTLASLLCALAPSLPLLVAARVLQGLGGACTSTIVPALLRLVYPPKQVGTGIGYLALTVASSALAARILPASPGLPRPFDAVGALLNAMALALLIIGVGTLGDARAHPVAFSEIAAGVACVALLVWQQRGRAAPLVPLDLLRIPALRLSVGTSICSYTAQTMAMLALPFMFVSELGRSASATGLLLTPWPLVIVFIAPLSGRLADRYRADVVGSVGLALLAAGLLTLVLLPAGPSNADIVWRVAFCGIGFGLFQTPNNRIMLTSAPQERSGAAGGVMTMARMIGMTLGAALATIMLDLYGTRGAHEAIVIAAVASGLGVVVAVMRMRQKG
jgi:DHA2 family multidrug resistance protein-like MFS transporter